MCWVCHLQDSAMAGNATHLRSWKKNEFIFYFICNGTFKRKIKKIISPLMKTEWLQDKDLILQWQKKPSYIDLKKKRESRKIYKQIIYKKGNVNVQ